MRCLFEGRVVFGSREWPGGGGKASTKKVTFAFKKGKKFFARLKQKKATPRKIVGRGKGGHARKGVVLLWQVYQDARVAARKDQDESVRL